MLRMPFSFAEQVIPNGKRKIWLESEKPLNGSESHEETNGVMQSMT